MADEDCRAVEAVFAFIGRDFPRDAVVHGDCCLTLVDRTLPPATNAAVGCDPDTGRVNLLNLGFGKHTGLVSTAIYPDPISSRFPVDVVRLDQLEYLYLDGNNITYLIPENITLLSRLSVLDLSYNALTGAAPNVAAFPRLTELYVNDNWALSGPTTGVTAEHCVQNSTMPTLTKCGVANTDLCMFEGLLGTACVAGVSACGTGFDRCNGVDGMTVAINATAPTTPPAPARRSGSTGGSAFTATTIGLGVGFGLLVLVLLAALTWCLVKRQRVGGSSFFSLFAKRPKHAGQLGQPAKRSARLHAGAASMHAMPHTMTHAERMADAKAPRYGVAHVDAIADQDDRTAASAAADSAADTYAHAPMHDRRFSQASHAPWAHVAAGASPPASLYEAPQSQPSPSPYHGHPSDPQHDIRVSYHAYDSRHDDATSAHIHAAARHSHGHRYGDAAPPRHATPRVPPPAAALSHAQGAAAHAPTARQTTGHAARRAAAPMDEAAALDAFLARQAALAEQDVV